jgi:hypothetical protein
VIFLGNIDILSIIIVVIFLAPIIFGAVRKFKQNGLFNLLNGIIYTIEVLICLVLSVYLSKMIFFENTKGIFKKIYDFIPAFIRNSLIGNNVLIFIVVIPVIFVVSMVLISLITTPLMIYVINPFSDYLDKKIKKTGTIKRHIIAALMGIPTGLCFVIIVVLMLNVYSYFFYNPNLKSILTNSYAYQLIYRNTVLPVIDSSLVKKIPVLFNDSFKKITASGNTNNSQTQNKIKIIEYFNGVTIEEAVKSNSQIDNKARDLVKTEKTETMKAYLLYKWISENIYYDYDKANRIVNKLNDVKSGSIVAYESRKGICFDYSCLYVSMCRAVNLKVRLITGLGYSGLSWGDHSWNEVYSREENRWISVDATFGKASNYFDNPTFGNDHTDRDLQQQWQ